MSLALLIRIMELTFVGLVGVAIVIEYWRRRKQWKRQEREWKDNVQRLAQEAEAMNFERRET